MKLFRRFLLLSAVLLHAAPKIRAQSCVGQGISSCSFQFSPYSFFRCQQTLPARVSDTCSRSCTHPGCGCQLFEGNDFCFSNPQSVLRFVKFGNTSSATRGSQQLRLSSHSFLYRFRCVGTPLRCDQIRDEFSCNRAQACQWIGLPVPAPFPAPAPTPTFLTGAEGTCEGSAIASCSADFRTQRCSNCGSDAECNALSATCATFCDHPGCSCEVDFGSCDRATNVGFNTVR